VKKKEQGLFLSFQKQKDIYIRMYKKVYNWLKEVPGTA